MRIVTALTMLLVHTKMCVPPRRASNHEHGPCSPARFERYASSPPRAAVAPQQPQLFFCCCSVEVLVERLARFWQSEDLASDVRGEFDEHRLKSSLILFGRHVRTEIYGACVYGACGVVRPV